jgi:hypothetical protein
MVRQCIGDGKMKTEASGGGAESRYALKRRQHDKGTWYWGVNFSRAGVHHARRVSDRHIQATSESA